MAVIPPFNPQERIPNNPFFTPQVYTLYSNIGGRLDFGSNFFVDYSTGTLYIGPNPPNNGTVRRVSAGVGLDTSPVGGVTITGSVSLQPLVTLVPGSYTYPTMSVDPYGHTYAIFNGITPLQTLTGTAPVFVSGGTVLKNIGITGASTSVLGAVALSNSVTDQATNKALTSFIAYVLGLQVGYLGSAAAGQRFGGTINGTTGLVDSVSFAGSTYPGIVLGSLLPSPSPALEGLYFYVSTPGNYTPPGGVLTSVVKNDKVECVGGVWEVIQSGYRPVAATTTTYGETVLATVPEVQALADNTKSVTPFSLSGMIASDTQLGFLEFATNIETAAFLDGVRAVTPANLSFLQASPATRGVVLLSDSFFDPSTTNAPTANALRSYVDGAFITADLITAKADLIVGLAPATPDTLPAGPNNSQLVVDVSKTLGLDWTVPDSLSAWPVGAVIWYLNGFVANTPDPWLPCDGSLYDASITGPYYDLFDLIGTTFNQGGDPAGFFRVPDLRGQFVRGWSGSTQPPYPGQTPAPATALDPGRTYASIQSSAYLQHNHGVTDPGHTMPFPIVQHCHPSNAATVNHLHGVSDPGHAHFIRTFPVSEVGSGNDSLYDNNENGGRPSGSVFGNFTNVLMTSAVTGVSASPATTGITINTITTGVTVNNAPPTAPTPDESRPYNIAMVPIIKY